MARTPKWKLAGWKMLKVKMYEPKYYRFKAYCIQNKKTIQQVLEDQIDNLIK